MWCSTIGWAGACALAVAAVPCDAQGFELFAHDYSARPENRASTEPAIAASRAAFHTAAPQPSFRETLYLPMIREAELRYGLPTRLLQALIWAESRFDPLAISPAGAAGLAQLMPATARELGVLNRRRASMAGRVTSGRCWTASVRSTSRSPLTTLDRGPWPKQEASHGTARHRTTSAMSSTAGPATARHSSNPECINCRLEGPSQPADLYRYRRPMGSPGPCLQLWAPRRAGDY
jgi:hypothetical protein